MTTHDQLRALIHAHYNGDQERFRITVHQIASSIKDERRRKEIWSLAQNQLVELPHEARGLVSPAPVVSWSELVLSPSLEDELMEIATELRHRTEFIARGIPPRCRLLFHGPPGNGKTSAAAALANLLGQSAFVVSVPGLIGSYMGTTGANLNKIFSVLRAGHLVVFDEIDCVGNTRGGADSSGSGREYNSVVNTLLTLLDERIAGTIVATTNRVDMLDPALLRRFDYQALFGRPTPELAYKLIAQLCAKYALAPDRIHRALGGQNWDSYSAIEQRVLTYARKQVLAEITAATSEGTSGSPAAAVAGTERTAGSPVVLSGPPLRRPRRSSEDPPVAPGERAPSETAEPSHCPE